MSWSCPSCYIMFLYSMKMFCRFSICIGINLTSLFQQLLLSPSIYSPFYIFGIGVLWSRITIWCVRALDFQTLSLSDNLSYLFWWARNSPPDEHVHSSLYSSHVALGFQTIGDYAMYLIYPLSIALAVNCHLLDVTIKSLNNTSQIRVL